MKKCQWVALLITLLIAGGVRAQAFDAEQLVLDVQKLGELKQILQDLTDGYQVLQSGYSTIRDIAKGSFDLHNAFLTGLLAVSPTVKSYERIGEIAALQVKLVQRYEDTWGRFQQDPHLRPEELAVLGQVYGSALAACATDLDDLVTLVTEGTIRASDAERMQEIDTIYNRMRTRAALVDRVSNETALLSLQRGSELDSFGVLKQLFGITP